jgi:hypothetical protein
MINLELGLAILGAFVLGLASFKGLVWLWNKKPVISFKNPIKTYVRKQVIEYLKELKNE